jgi:hypothetical protein
MVRYARGAALALALLPAAPALAVVNQPGGDIFFDGSFQGLTYGSSGAADLMPLLYIGDFASTLPPLTQISGTLLDFPIPTPAFGSSAVSITYSITNNESLPYNDLRLMLNLHAKGQPAALDLGAAQGLGGPGSPDAHQIFDFNAPGDKPLQRITTANGLNGTIAPDCASVTGCFTDLALQYNRAQLGPGETWTVSVMLVDDPSLVAGGRYLVAETLGSGGDQIFFGNVTLVPEPQTYAMLLAGIGVLALLRRRRG